MLLENLHGMYFSGTCWPSGGAWFQCRYGGFYELLLINVPWSQEFLQSVEFSLLCTFLTVGGVGWVACQGFLVRESCIGVLVGGAGFLLSGVQ